jgi:tRNA 2-thiouridine synthesizing protein D
MDWARVRGQERRTGGGEREGLAGTMKYAIQVNSGPGQSPSAQCAYQFIKAALAEGHEIVRMFFYHDGVYHGFGPARSPDDGVPDWSALAERHGIDLMLCASAAIRRGLLPPEETGWAQAKLAAGFRLGGLGQWLEACIKADRTLVFGG